MRFKTFSPSVAEETSRLKYELDQRIQSEHQLNSDLKKLRVEIEDLQREKLFLEKELAKARSAAAAAAAASGGVGPAGTVPPTSPPSAVDSDLVTGLRQDVATYKLKYDRVCTELTQLEQSKVSLEVQVRRMEEKSAANERALTQANQQVVAAQNAASQREREMQQRERERDQVRDREIEKLQQQHVQQLQQQQQPVTSQADLKNLNSALDQKTAEVEKFSQLVEQKNEAIKSLQAELRGLKAELEEDHGQVGGLRQEVDQNRAIIEKQTSDYKRLKDEYGKVVEEIKKSQELVAKHQAENLKFRGNYEEKANELARIKQLVEEKNNEVRVVFIRIVCIGQVVRAGRFGRIGPGSTGTEMNSKLMLCVQVAYKSKEQGKLQERLDRYKAQQDKYEKQMSKMEHEMMQLTSERDELVTQLEKSQELLVQFQKELNSRVQNNEENQHEVMLSISLLLLLLQYPCFTREARVSLTYWSRELLNHTCLGYRTIRAAPRPGKTRACNNPSFHLIMFPSP